MSQFIVGVVTMMLVVGAGVLVFLRSDQQALESSNKEQAITAHLESVKAEQEYTSEDLLATQGAYLPYDEKYIGRNSTDKTVLFFNASWCPTCTVAVKGFQQNANKIPAGITILDVDYDAYQDLRSKYGVTVQHTYVQVAPNGDLIKKWHGSYIVSQLLDQLE